MVECSYTQRTTLNAKASSEAPLYMLTLTRTKPRFATVGLSSRTTIEQSVFSTGTLRSDISSRRYRFHTRVSLTGTMRALRWRVRCLGARSDMICPDTYTRNHEIVVVRQPVPARRLWWNEHSSDRCIAISYNSEEAGSHNFQYAWM